MKDFRSKLEEILTMADYYEREAGDNDRPFNPEEQVDSILSLIDKELPKKKRGIERRVDKEDGGYYLTCLECGGYDECDCEGYNRCIDDIRTKLGLQERR